MKFTEQNEKERLKFVDLWSSFVLTHSDRVWSRQQNRIINSCMRSASMSRKAFLDMKAPGTEGSRKRPARRPHTLPSCLPSPHAKTKLK